METIRLIAFVLACILSLSLLACKGADPNTPETDTAATTANTTAATQQATETAAAEEPKVIVTKTYQIAEILDEIKVFGRTSTLSTGLTCDHSASGIEFNAYIEGTLTLGLTVTADCYFTLYVDGVRSERRIEATSATESIDLVSFENGGVHNIRLIKQTEPMNALCVLSTLAFRGYLEKAPANETYLVEFIGASYTVGYGNLLNGGNATISGKAVNQDVTQAYSYLTAQKLGVDHSIVCVSGIGIVKGFRDFPIGTMFAAQSYFRDQAAAYEPTRVPDLVVIAVGSNDESKGTTQAEYQAGVSALITQVREKYQKDVPIVWVNYTSNAGSAAYHESAQKAVTALGGESAGIYTCTLVFNKLGGNNHPNLESHAAKSDELATFILTHDILK